MEKKSGTLGNALIGSIGGGIIGGKLGQGAANITHPQSKEIGNLYKEKENARKTMPRGPKITHTEIREELDKLYGGNFDEMTVGEFEQAKNKVIKDLYNKKGQEMFKTAKFKKELRDAVKDIRVPKSLTIPAVVAGALGANSSYKSTKEKNTNLPKAQEERNIAVGNKDKAVARIKSGDPYYSNYQTTGVLDSHRESWEEDDRFVDDEIKDKGISRENMKIKDYKKVMNEVFGEWGDGSSKTAHEILEDFEKIASTLDDASIELLARELLSEIEKTAGIATNTLISASNKIEAAGWKMRDAGKASGNALKQKRGMDIVKFRNKNIFTTKNLDRAYAVDKALKKAPTTLAGAGVIGTGAAVMANKAKNKGMSNDMMQAVASESLQDIEKLAGIGSVIKPAFKAITGASKAGVSQVGMKGIGLGNKLSQKGGLVGKLGKGVTQTGEWAVERPGEALINGMALGAAVGINHSVNNMDKPKPDYSERLAALRQRKNPLGLEKNASRAWKRNFGDLSEKAQDFLESSKILDHEKELKGLRKGTIEIAKKNDVKMGHNANILNPMSKRVSDAYDISDPEERQQMLGAYRSVATAGGADLFGGGARGKSFTVVPTRPDKGAKKILDDALFDTSTLKSHGRKDRLSKKYTRALMGRHEMDEVTEAKRLRNTKGKSIYSNELGQDMPTPTQFYSHASPSILARESKNVAIAPKGTKEYMHTLRSLTGEKERLGNSGLQYGKSAVLEKGTSRKLENEQVRKWKENNQ